MTDFRALAAIPPDVAALIEAARGPAYERGYSDGMQIAEEMHRAEMKRSGTKTAHLAIMEAKKHGIVVGACTATAAFLLAMALVAVILALR